MSTQQSTTDAQFPATAVPLVAAGPPVRRFTVDEYHRMIESGILLEDDRVELLDGWILEMSPIGPPHEVCVSLILAALQQILPRAWFVRVQAPITLATGEPQPDLAVVRGKARDYLSHHPGPPDIALLIEIADSSLQFDRLQKRRQYAIAGIPEYWIVNLVNRCLEVCRDPAGGDYGIREIIDAVGSIELAIDGTVVSRFEVADLLP